jgi:hypothetical protein
VTEHACEHDACTDADTTPCLGDRTERVYDGAKKCPRRRANDPGAGHHLLGGDDMAKRTCSIEGCESLVHARGWCITHYSRWRTTGTTANPFPRPRPPCSIPDCDRPFYALGWCNMHWDRHRRTGTTDSPPAPPPVEELFWAKVDKNGPLPVLRPDLGPCWLWAASLNTTGYGQFSFKRTMTQAHRVAYRLTIGPIPSGLVLDHLCDRRACVNPDHLTVTTHRQNILRGGGASAVNLRKTHCIRGHEFTEENTYRRPSQPHIRQCRICCELRSQARSERRRRARG